MLLCWSGCQNVRPAGGTETCDTVCASCGAHSDNTLRHTKVSARPSLTVLQLVAHEAPEPSFQQAASLSHFERHGELARTSVGIQLRGRWLNESSLLSSGAEPIGDLHMKRREFLASTAGLIGSTLPVVGHTLSDPCPPSRLQVAGGTSVSTSCGDQPVGDTYVSQQASTMSAGQWKQISTNGLSTAMFVDGANNTLDYLDKGAYDPINRQVRFIGQSHYGDQRYHQYDEATNTWSNVADPPWDTGGSGPPPFIGHGYQHNTIDETTGDHYYRQYNDTQPRRLNRSTGTWSQLPSAGSMEIAGGVEWLPTIGTQGGLVFYVNTNVRYWNKASNTWATGSTNISAGPYHNCAVRNRATNEVYFGGGNGSGALYKINGSGAVTALPTCPITYGIGATITTVCPTSGQMLVIASNSNAYKFNGTSWSALSMSGAPSFGSVGSGSKIIAIPMLDHGVIMFLFGGTPAVWLYRHT